MRPAVGLLGGVVMLTLAIAGASCGRDDTPAVSPAGTAVPADADRPTPGGEVVRRCGSHYAAEFDAGMQSRIVAAGPVSLVTFRVAPVHGSDAPVRTFKAMVRLEAGAEADLETVTDGTSLLYDRSRFSASNVYALSDGERRVRFVGCADQPALFNGTVLTSGPTTVDLQVVVDGRRSDLRVSAYDG